MTARRENRCHCRVNFVKARPLPGSEIPSSSASACAARELVQGGPVWLSVLTANLVSTMIWGFPYIDSSLIQHQHPVHVGIHDITEIGIQSRVNGRELTIMHSVILHSERDSDTFPYTYLMEWEWPEHIELLLRRLIWARLVELTEETDEVTVAESDHLAAKVCWLIAKSPQTHPAVSPVESPTWLWRSLWSSFWIKWDDVHCFYVIDRTKNSGDDTTAILFPLVHQ